MKNKLMLLTAVAFCIASSAFAVGPNAIGGGARYHVNHSSFTELPFGNSDFSYCAVYEYGNESAYWQVVADYAPEVTGEDGVDYALTPALNLILKDKTIRGGIGILDTYVSGDDTRWTDLYWQIILGVEVPIGERIGIEIFAFYPFQGWDEWKDFELRNIEAGAWVNFKF